MKFEKPIMNISMFEMENVVTISGTALSNAEAKADALVNAVLTNGDRAVKVRITF